MCRKEFGGANITKRLDEIASMPRNKWTKEKNKWEKKNETRNCRDIEVRGF